MKTLRIGYVPNSKKLDAPGDRRRIVFWAKARGHEIVTNLDDKFDVLVLSERSDLGFFVNRKIKAPIIFDLVDGYLARESLAKDWFRGTSKVVTRQLSGLPRPFTQFVQDMCITASAVICSSPEQSELISKHSKNVHVILDSHDEIPWLEFQGNGDKFKTNRNLLWEGLPVTLGGIKNLSQPLIHENREYGTGIKFVTDQEYYRLLGQYFPASTGKLLSNLLGPMSRDTELISWNVENLVSSAKLSRAAIIPVMLSNKLQYFKPENRLLIMWKLALPTIVSATPSYTRVSNISGSDIVSKDNSEWAEKLTLLHNQDYAEDLVRRGQDYLKTNHTKEILLLKWDNAFESVLQ
ncbi:MAG: hypothetical protein K9G01_00800 [Candidatus Planktophila sp.]|nr:hypothetical protein [Candidatus Planktophila sp.]